MDKKREVQNAQIDPQCVTDAVCHGALNSLPALYPPLLTQILDTSKCALELPGSEDLWRRSSCCPSPQSLVMTLALGF